MENALLQARGGRLENCSRSDVALDRHFPCDPGREILGCEAGSSCNAALADIRSIAHPRRPVSTR